MKKLCTPQQIKIQHCCNCDPSISAPGPVSSPREGGGNKCQVPLIIDKYIK